MTISDPSSGDETELSSDEGEAHVLDEDPTLCCDPFYCKDCGRLFLSEKYLKNHIGTKGCRPIENNMTIEGRTIRMLQKKLTDKTTVVRSWNDSITHVAPRNALTNELYTESFQHGWAAKPRHGFSKGHTYMTQEYKKSISQYFKIGSDDKKKEDVSCVDVRSTLW